MYNVIIFGTGSTSKAVLKLLKNEINIIAYADNDTLKWNSYFYDKRVTSPDEIKNYKYDFIIIASYAYEVIYEQLINLGVKPNKILRFYKFYDFYLETLKNRVDRFNNDENIECIITGISYTRCAIKEEILLKKTAMFALESQDLYYDYKIAKYLIEQKVQDIKYVIIGLCYYTFQYDMSLSKKRDRVMLYYDILKIVHNFHQSELFLKEYKVEKEILNKLIKKKDSLYMFNMSNNILTEGITNSNYGAKMAIMDSNKNYPKTVLENKNILKEYLQFLNKHNIEPIIVIPPTSSSYSTFFSKEIENEFQQIILQLQQKNKFQYIDCFRNENFNDKDFYDPSHLNKNGAIKFTSILNDKIRW